MDREYVLTETQINELIDRAVAKEVSYYVSETDKMFRQMRKAIEPYKRVVADEFPELIRSIERVSDNYDDPKMNMYRLAELLKMAVLNCKYMNDAELLVFTLETLVSDNDGRGSIIEMMMDPEYKENFDMVKFVNTMLPDNLVEAVSKFREERGITGGLQAELEDFLKEI